MSDFTPPECLGGTPAPVTNKLVQVVTSQDDLAYVAFVLNWYSGLPGLSLADRQRAAAVAATFSREASR
jgi:hypothetical protein